VALVRRLAQLPSSSGPGRAQFLVGQFRALVQAHAADGWTVPEYARELGVRVERLSRACRAIAGRSPMRMVHDRRMAEAKRSLMYTAMSVQEVAFSLGFDDPAYFTRFFVRWEGRSPIQFRRSARRGDGEPNS